MIDTRGIKIISRVEKVLASETEMEGVNSTWGLGLLIHNTETVHTNQVCLLGPEFMLDLP